MINDLYVDLDSGIEIRMKEFVGLRRDDRGKYIGHARFEVSTEGYGYHRGEPITTQLWKHNWNRKTGEWFDDEDPNTTEEDYVLIEELTVNDDDIESAIKNHKAMIEKAKELIKQELGEES